MDEEVYNEILAAIPSNKIYEEFKSEVDEENNEISCDIFNSIKSKYKDKCVKLCKNVARNFKYLYERGKPENYDYRCSHYKFWVYKEIEKMFEKNSAGDDVKDVITQFLNLQTSLTGTYGLYNCNYIFLKKNLEELDNKNKEKYLYEYFTNYDSIKSKDICIKVDVKKYKKYINFISSLYKNKKENCCWNEKSVCPHYFLKCGEEFNPSKLLSVLESDNGDSCNRLESFKETISIKKKLDSNILERAFLNSILLTDCPINNNSTILRCGFIRASSVRSSSGNAVENNEQRTNAVSSSSGIRMIKANADSSKVLSERIIKQFATSVSEEKHKMSSVENPGNEFRWNFAKGTLNCPPKRPEEDKYGMCEYIEELVEDGFFEKTEDSKGYKYKRGPLWNHKYLVNVARNKRQEKLRKSTPLKLNYSGRLQAIIHNKGEVSYASKSKGKAVPEKDIEYNVLRNTFSRISIVGALVLGIIFVFFLYFKFTPFGSYVGKIKKRKKRYRTNLAQLNRQRIPRRFIKRTYRNSDRRRFSVVNIE
ncbi:PIR protein [Plasmodium malariae]|uniref:PIR protein n=1 Tax=Plasmodium malariae TaxID=5858 RepID=A0A1D3JK54_PLAMA|nr:PIR protein [Plasmodium malariae]SBT86779.1 PIR protein [Plasmodium malariae]